MGTTIRCNLSVQNKGSLLSYGFPPSAIASLVRVAESNDSEYLSVKIKQELEHLNSMNSLKQSCSVMDILALFAE